ncbi:hypothetical protein NQZ68_034889 [Dissostichus eleginoides]|nr:hypothetical protein NQZ68_034889 [Dissostichus eleginoides]
MSKHRKAVTDIKNISAPVTWAEFQVSLVPGDSSSDCCHGYDAVATDVFELVTFGLKVIGQLIASHHGMKL